jgi:hypothetical protein
MNAAVQAILLAGATTVFLVVHAEEWKAEPVESSW